KQLQGARVRCLHRSAESRMLKIQCFQRFNQGEKNHSEYGCHHPIGCGPGLNKAKKGESLGPMFTSLLPACKCCRCDQLRHLLLPLRHLLLPCLPTLDCDHPRPPAKINVPSL
ncbi:mCG144842, partial [Mus musculus]